MTWLAWRQFRAQAFVVLALLAAAAVYVLITGTQLRHSYNADLAACQAQNNCFGLLNGLQSQYNGPLDLSALVVMAAPALIGIFWGAPLIAAELERGTQYLVWNQSVSRTRWLAVKLALVALTAVATAGLLSLLITWWASPLDAMASSRFGTQTFNARNIAPLGYAAFAFALGATLGLLIRRTIPAMAATLAVFVALQMVVTIAVRPNILPATTVTMPVNQTTMSQVARIDRSGTAGALTVDMSGPAGAWIQNETAVLTSAGVPVADSEIASCFDQFTGGAAGKGKGPSGFGTFGACLAPDNLHVDITYQPASHYWPLQWLETALYAALAALLAAVCFRRIRRS
jgi:ABC-type transport system involved in multi-copper enzyme maturation permease subunit